MTPLWLNPKACIYHAKALSLYNARSKSAISRPRRLHGWIQSGVMPPHSMDCGGMTPLWLNPKACIYHAKALSLYNARSESAISRPRRLHGWIQSGVMPPHSMLAVVRGDMKLSSHARCSLASCTASPIV